MEKPVSETQSNNISEKDVDDLRNAYQSLPQMIAFEGQKPWSALSVFIQFAFVLVAGAIGTSYLPDTSNDKVSALIGLFLSLIGAVSACMWFSFNKRHRKITRYWVLSMRELEDKLSSSLIAFQRGKDFAEGKQVIVSGEPIQYKNLERLPVRAGFQLIYIVFLLVFVFLSVMNINRLVMAL